MTINCFPDNFIPLNGDCRTYTTQSSGLYINDLPGLSLKLLASLSNEEQLTASNLYQVSHSEGIRQFLKDFNIGLDKYNYKNVLGSQRNGKLASTFTETTGTKVIGKEFTKINCYDRYQCFYIEYLEFYASEDFTLDFDVIDGCNTITKTVDLVCGLNRIPVDYEAQSDKIQIVYDSSDTYLIDDLQCWDTGQSCSCNGNCSSGSNGYQGYTVKDIELSGSVYVQSSIKNGLVVAASTRCSKYELACIFKEEAAPVIRYAIGIDILRRIQFSERTNPLVRNKKEDIGEQLILWNGGTSKITGFTHKGEYHKELKSLIKKANSFLSSQAGSSKCIECSGSHFKQVLP